METTIENAFENRAQGFDDKDSVEAAVEAAIDLLDSESCALRKSAVQTGTSING